MLTTSNPGSYSVVVSNPSGPITTSAATLTIYGAPTIETQPVSQSIFAGQTATFSLSASGAGPLSYQWRKENQNLPDEISPSLTVSNQGSYSAIVSNQSGATFSSVATLSFYPAPTIAIQPVSQSVYEGQSVTFGVVASGAGPFSYQWRKDGQNLAGEISPNLTVANVGAFGGGDFTVVVSNGSGSVTSTFARLTILPPPYLQSLGDSLNANIQTRATQTSLDSFQAVLDTKLGLTASQSSIDNLRGLATFSFDTNILSRASQTSADAIRAKVDSLDLTWLDTNVASRASQSSLDGVAANVGLFSAQVDGAKATVVGAMQTTANALTDTFNAAEISDQTSLGVILGN